MVIILVLYVWNKEEGMCLIVLWELTNIFYR